MRRSTLDGVYDAHTNMMFYPKIMQPTHARWEQIPPFEAILPTRQLADAAPLTNGHADGGFGMQVGTTLIQPKPVPALVSQNFAVIDTVFTAPPIAGVGFPGPDDAVTDPTAGTTGLGHISQDLVDELPDHCRKAFEQAKKLEAQWKQQWGTERDSGLRGDLRIGFNGYPV